MSILGSATASKGILRVGFASGAIEIISPDRIMIKEVPIPNTRETVSILPGEEPYRRLMNENAVPTQRAADKVEISIHLDSEILEQIKHLTNDPSRVIETAIKQWLRGERQPDDDLTRTLRRNPPLPPKGEWND